MQTFGSRAQVMHGTAMKTPGGLTKKILRKNKHGRIVSVKASKSARKKLSKHKSSKSTMEPEPELNLLTLAALMILSRYSGYRKF